MRSKIILGVLLLVLAFCLTGCFSKTVISSSEFTTKMSGLGYTVIDITDQYSSIDYVNHVIVAQNVSNNFQIEYFELSNSEYASQAYLTNINTMESSKGSSATGTSFSGTNYQKQTQSSNGEYWVVSRVDNTFIFAHTSDVNKDAVNNVLDTLGY